MTHLLSRLLRLVFHTPNPLRATQLLQLGLFILILSGCANFKRQESDRLFEQGRYVESVRILQQASAQNPNNTTLKTGYLARQTQAAERLLSLALSLRAQNKNQEAETLTQQILEFDANNQRARTLLADLERDARHQTWLKKANDCSQQGQLTQAFGWLNKILSENARHTEALALQSRLETRQRLDQEIQTEHLADSPPFSLEFRDADLKMIFEVLNKHSGINFILDKDLPREAKATLFLKETRIEDALELLARTNQLGTKILNPHTVLIYPNTPDKQKDYQDLLVKAFFLANAEAKTLGAQLKNMLKLKDLMIDDKLNALILRDTPNAIRVTERMINLLDLNEPEVMLEVEVLEINRTRLHELGINFPNQVTFSPLPPSGSGTTLSFLKNINSNQIGVGFSNPALNLRMESGDINTLANPRIRVKNKEKAKILIGERLPVVSTTATANFITENIEYTEIGIKLEVEPQISLEDEITIKAALEVSSVSNQIKTSSGSMAYQIGTRNANTVLKLRDGETQVLAGLLSNAERSSGNRIPGLGDLPLIGRLFGSTLDNSQKTEVLLSITPHLVRNIRRPDVMDGEFWSGTETRLGLNPIALPIRPKTTTTPNNATANSPTPNTPNLDQPNNSTNLPTHNNTTPNNLASETPFTPSTRTGGITAKAPTQIALEWQTPKPSKINEPQHITLQLNSNGALRGLPVQIGFDPQKIQVLEVAEGEFFRQDQGGTSFNYQIADNKLLISSMRNGLQGVFGNTSLVTIQYRLLKAEPAELRILESTPLGEGKLPVVLPPPPLRLEAQQ